MSKNKEDDKDKQEKKTLSLSGKGTLSLKGGPGAPAQVKQSFSHGRSKTVAVEVRRKRGAAAETETTADQASPSIDSSNPLHNLTQEERDARAKALREAIVRGEEKAAAGLASEPGETGDTDLPISVDLAQRELEELKQIEEQERRRLEEEESRRTQDAYRTVELTAGRKISGTDGDDDDAEKARRNAKVPPRKATTIERRRGGKITVAQALNAETTLERERGPSMAARRRARERERLRAMSGSQAERIKQFREVTIPETISVQDLANRMTERTADVVKKLMEMGVMVTATQVIDADTAELVTREFGHSVKRVSESDVELVGDDQPDKVEDLRPRPPVVTIMGHVDHGKTSLLDAIRQTDVVSGEAGGITQHIGAYQVQLKTGQKITFLDTPGHAAFTEMRARGADVTDIVVLVVAADDSVMPQTIEAISHAKAANKPIIVAINKCDKPSANPDKVRQQLLQHEIVVEQMGGETLNVEVSALTKKGLDKLEEAILLQAEVLDLKANPNRAAQGAVVEARLEQGRGSVATILIQRGTLKPGDIFVAGTEWGRVRALLNDRNQPLKEGIPGQPVEVLGINGTPDAGDSFIVVPDEAKARQIADYRMRKKREKAAVQSRKTNVEQMFSQLKDGMKQLPVVIKADVHGSVEAIAASLRKLTEENKEVQVTILHSGVGGITESDITLANASKAMVIGFNVRANAPARELARRDGMEIRYYSVIYEVIDDVKALLGGLLSPSVHENITGYAEIRQVFSVSKAGKVAGCMVTSGIIRRASKVRLLRDDVVIHEGTLKTLRRFKDEAKEVREGFECGMAFENYDDIREGDVIEAFELEEKARVLENA